MIGTIAILMVLGFLFLFLEIFLPGAVMGIVGALLLASGVVLSFVELESSTALGILLATLGGSIGVFILGFRIFPHTPMGRKMILTTSEKQGDGFVASSDELRQLEGKTGVAISTLRPAGIADFDGTRVDVVTEGDFIEHGEKVSVILIDGNRVVVGRIL